MWGVSVSSVTLSDQGVMASPGWGTGSPPFCILLRVPKWGGGKRAGHARVKNLGQTGSTATPKSFKWNLFLRWKVGQWWKDSLFSGAGRGAMWLSVVGDCWIIVQRWTVLGAFHLSKQQSRAEVENQAWNSRKSSPANLVFTAIYERGDRLADSRRCSYFPKVFWLTGESAFSSSNHKTRERQAHQANATGSVLPHHPLVDTAIKIYFVKSYRSSGVSNDWTHVDDWLLCKCEYCKTSTQ